MRARGVFAAGMVSMALLGAPRVVEGSTLSLFVDSAFFTSGSLIYDSATVTQFIDPSVTNWIAWNNANFVGFVNAGCTAFIGGSGVCLGPGGFGTDDYIALTVIAPGGASLTVNIDQNNDVGNSFGVQNAIFGTAANSPDAIRISPFFGSPPNSTTIFNDPGPFNALFVTAGTYTFTFSFRNNDTGPAGHSDIYLLWNVNDAQAAAVPEPATLVLLSGGLLGLSAAVRRRKLR